MSSYFVIGPIAAIWVAFFALYRVAAKRDRQTPVHDIGVFFLFVLSLYTTLPPLVWLAQGGAYENIVNWRLYRAQPTPQDVFYLVTIAMAYAICFSIVYVFLQRSIRRPIVAVPSYVDGKVFAGAIAMTVVTGGITLLLSVIGIARGAESYIDTYRVIAELPLLTKQLLKINSGISSVARLIVLVGLLQRWPKHRYWFYFYVLSILLIFDAEGSRAPIVSGFLAVMIAWHVLVRPIATSRWLAMFLIAFGSFLLLGVWRQLEPGAPLTPEMSDMALGEFDALWANAVELLQAQDGGLHVPPAVYWGEFFAFIPSQLLPFDKISLADWFLDEFYPGYKAEGGGWAFGALSQAVVGAGLPDAMLRGAALGAVSVWLIKWVSRAERAWWRFPAYLYILVFSFQSVRSSTFILLGDLIQIVLPTILLVIVFANLLSKRRSASSTN